MNRLLLSVFGLLTVACGGGSTAPTTLQPVNVPPPSSAGDVAVFLGDFEGTGIDELYVARTDGTSVRKVSHPLGASDDVLQYQLSPDQKYAAYVSGTGARGDFYIVRLADLDRVQLPLLSRDIWPQICWAPDGSRLAIALTESTTQPAPHEMYTVRPDGTGLARLSDSRFSVGGITWSPDSKRIWFSARPLVPGPTEAFAATADGTSSQRITPPMTDDSRFEGAAFAPNSASLAVFVQVLDDGEYRPYLTRVPGGVAQGLAPSTGGPAQVRDGAWSPDSRQLTYMTDAGRSRSRYVLRITDGTGPGVNRKISHALSSEDSVSRQRWSPDGKWIAYEASRQITRTELWITDVNGNASQVTPGRSTNAKLGRWRWSPNARWLAFYLDDNNDSIDDFYLWEVGSSAAPVLIDTGVRDTDPPSWSPTSDRVIFRDRDGQINSISVATPMDIMRISDNAAGIHLTRASCRDHFLVEWSADGKTVVYLETFGHTGARLVARASDASTPAIDMSGLTQQFVSIRGYVYRSIRFPTTSVR